MKDWIILSSFIMTLTILTACQTSNTGSGEEIVPGVELQYMDTTVHPGDDFFRYVNGGWLDAYEIPDDRSRWGSFDELNKSTSSRVLEVLQEAIKSGKYTGNSDQAKAALFFDTAMDSLYLDQAGIKPILPELEKIQALGSLREVVDYIINTASFQTSHFFGFYVSPDPNNSDINAAFLRNGSLGLPERDYYTNTDEHTLKIQEEYKKHIARMFGIIGTNPETAGSMAENIFEIEKQMASAQMTREQRRNPMLRNNPRSISQLNMMMPVLDWGEYIKRIGANHVDTIIVTDVNYFNNLTNVLKEQNLKVIREYMSWVLLNRSASYLTTELETASFDFYGKTLRGTPAMLPRWERVLSVANAAVGEAIGKLYTEKYFPPQAKAAAQEMVDNIIVAFGERIKNLEWMTDPTKEKALEKLSTFNVKIGYPDEWKDYSLMVVKGKEDGGNYLENVMNASKWRWNEDLAKIGKPVDKNEWFMSPQTVNAYYNPLFNEIVFPAAILQPPFYNYRADAAVNYGGIGAVIGHEISHGFDDQGSQYDAKGNLKNWWTEEDRRRFNERSKLLVDQFNEYEPLEGVRINGTISLGENIGDLGGVNVAYDGLQLHLRKNGDPGLIDGFTQDQRFFISWGTIWRTKMRDEALRTHLATAPHSPGMFRAFAPLLNIDSFYEAFGITEEQKLYIPKEERILIW
jgi:putative endopeptidase